MAWKLLPTDYTDAVWSGLKRYTQVDNSDGTVSFNDVMKSSWKRTLRLQNGSSQTSEK